MIAAVVYEDQRARTKGFGPHELAIACVYDDVNDDRFALPKMLEDHPKKGVDKLILACRNEMDLLAPAGQPVVALVDADRVREHLGLDADAPPNVVVEMVCEGSPRPAEVFLLERNMESVIAAARACLHLDPLLKKPNPEDRDITLSKAAWGTAGVRRCIRDAVPSFDRFVTRLSEIVRAARAEAAAP